VDAFQVLGPLVLGDPPQGRVLRRFVNEGFFAKPIYLPPSADFRASSNTGFFHPGSFPPCCSSRTPPPWNHHDGCSFTVFRQPVPRLGLFFPSLLFPFLYHFSPSYYLSPPLHMRKISPTFHFLAVQDRPLRASFFLGFSFDFSYSFSIPSTNKVP